MVNYWLCKQVQKSREWNRNGWMGWRPHTEFWNKTMWIQNHTMLLWINIKRIDNVSCCFENQPCGFGKKVSTMLKKDGCQDWQCVVSKQHVWHFLELKLTRVKSKLLLQLLWCGFNICLFLFDRTARIDTTEVSTCWVVLVVSNLLHWLLKKWILYNRPRIL